MKFFFALATPMIFGGIARAQTFNANFAHVSDAPPLIKTKLGVY